MNFNILTDDVLLFSMLQHRLELVSQIKPDPFFPTALLVTPTNTGKRVWLVRLG